MVVYLTMLNLMRAFSFLYCPTNRFSKYLYYLNRTIFAEGGSRRTGRTRDAVRHNWGYPTHMHRR